MTGCNYPSDWQERRHTVITDHLNRCVNCHQVADHHELEVHHIVPVGQAGTHRESNLVPLCPACHDAAHRKAMAPRVRWFSNGELSGDEFTAHKELWQGMRERLGVPRYDPDEDCVYIPVADKERILRQLPA